VQLVDFLDPGERILPADQAAAEVRGKGHRYYRRRLLAAGWGSALARSATM
jgi:hypothetical protein